MNVKLPVDSLVSSTPTTPRSTETALSADAVQISITQSNRSFAQRGKWDLLSYPTFAAVSGDVDAIANQLNTYVQSRIAEAEKSNGIELEISADPTYISQHLVLFNLEERQYNKGAAHGMTNYESFAFDATTGERFDLWSQVKPERLGAFQQMLYEEITAQFAGQLFDDETVKSSLQDRVTLRSFTPYVGGMKLTLNVYDYAPYSEGPLELWIDWQDLGSLLDEKSVLGQVFKSKLK